MTDLNTFLQKNVEGYLFEDLQTMKAATLAPGKQAGAIGYPLLMSTFAGIELLGALLSDSPFDKNEGRQYFKDFWRNHLYSTDPYRAAAGDAFYQLARHGLAHAYVTKGDIVVFKHDPAMHLVRAPDGSIYIDAAQLADDLEHCYKAQVKPAASKRSRGASMKARLREMQAAYRSQADKYLPLLKLPPAPFITSVGSGSAISYVTSSKSTG